MKTPILTGAALLAASFLAPTASAQLPEPGSVLVYPIHRTELGLSLDPIALTLINLTNTNLNPLQGATNAHFQYVNTITSVKGGKEKVLDCMVTDRVEHLTPADTLSVLTNCHNPANQREGYLVVSAQDPNLFMSDWAFNYLVGSEVVINKFGSAFSLNAIPFGSEQPMRTSTDLDGDGQLDFDGVEYDMIPDDLILDSFVAIANSDLILINMTGGTQFDTVVAFDIFNDNEFPLSATTEFRCWMDRCLWAGSTIGFPNTTDDCISLVFSNDYLLYNTPNDEAELDINCDGKQDNIETGWARIRGLVANSTIESIPNPALLGASSSIYPTLGGRVLWGSRAKQANGDFLNFGANDPEN